MTMLNDAHLWQEAQARARLQHAALHRAQEQRLLVQLTAALVRPQEPLSGPAIKRALRTQAAWCVLHLVYADDTLHVQVARRAASPQGGLIWACWRPLRVVVRGWLDYRRTPQELYAPVAEAWELVGARPGAGQAG